MEKSLQEVKRIAKDIEDIVIQGATDIARQACKIMEKQLRESKLKNKKDLETFFDKASSMLIGARETEPLLRNAMKYAKFKIHEGCDAKGVADAFEEYLMWMERENEVRPTIGAELIHDGDDVFTHCHSTSVIDIFKNARDNGKKFHVYNTETRPLYQGRKTSRDLINAGIPDTMVTDSSAGFFVDNTLGNTVDIKEIFLGSDCIKPDGTVINKIGSFSIGLSAWNSGVPLYVVGSLLKVDTMDKVGIETRNGKELWPEAPDGLEIVNFAFDRVPHKCITGIVTEFGVIRPENLMREVKKHYPRMLE